MLGFSIKTFRLSLNFISPVSKMMDYLPEGLDTSMELSIFCQILVKIYHGRSIMPYCVELLCLMAAWLNPSIGLYQS